MADPLSISASVMALLSAGITATTSIVEFYTSYKQQDSQIDSITGKLRELLSIFESLTNTFANRAFRADEHIVIEIIETSVTKCHALFAEFQGKCKKFNTAKIKGVREIFKVGRRRALYPFYKSTLLEIDRGICEIRENLALAIDVLQVRTNQSIGYEIDGMKKAVSSIRIHQKSKELHDWLKPSDVIEAHRMAYEKKYPETGTWLFKDPNFMTWFADANSILWLNGFAGTGKSVLCSTVIEFVSRYQATHSSIGLAFFYFTFSDESKQTESVMLRTLFWQLSSQVENGNEELDRLFRRHKTGLPTPVAMMDHLRRLLQKFQHAYVIVDALDECSRNGARENVLETLETMRKWSLQGLHLFVTSRDEVDIRTSLTSSVNQIKMSNVEIDQDIARFIEGRLHDDRRLQKWSASRGIIQEKLGKRAQGIFRWADCQIRDLQRCPRSDDHLERLLNSLPQSLEETYERIICNVDSSSIDDAQRILTLLCFAPRPLTVKELIDGIAVEIGSLRLNAGRRFRNASDIHEICSSLIDIDLNIDDANGMSGGDSLKHNIRLAHSSVEEYLKLERISHSGANKMSFDKGTANTEMALICLIYLLEPGLSSATTMEDILENYPLAPFAAKYWSYHYTRAEQQLSKLDDLILELFQSDCSFVTSIKLYDPDDSRPQNGFLLSSNQIAGPIYYASLLGLGQVLRQLIDVRRQQVLEAVSNPWASAPKIPGIDEQDGEYGNALQAASYMGHEDVVQLLLEKGAYVNAEGGNYGNALQAASYMGHRTVVELLLKEGANVNAQGGKYGNSLQAACYEGHEAIIRILIDNHANVNAEGGYFGTALQAASAEGHIDTVHLLCENQANVNAPGGYFGNALAAAREEGHEKIATFLTTLGALSMARGKAPGPSPEQIMIKQNVRVNQKIRAARSMLAASRQIDSNAYPPRIYSRALTEAVVKGHERIVRLLIEKMTNVDVQEKYRNALQVAPIHGHERIAQFLLEKIATANPNSLFVALYKGYEDVVQLLLEKGWPVNVQNEENDFALGVASENGHEKIAHILIEKGADVNASDTYGTALQRASASGHENMVKLLLDKGANIDAEGGKLGPCKTALQEAAKHGHEKIVQLLLERYDSTSTDGRRKYGIALQYASASGHENIAKLLLDKGADVNAPERGDVGTAWREAAVHGHDGIVQLLLERDAIAKEKYGEALEFASIYGHHKIVRYILERDANFQENYKEALSLTLSYGQENVVRLLLERSAVMPKEYLMPLDEALSQGYGSMVKFWLENGADLDKDAALEAAARIENYQIVKLLVEHGASILSLGKYFETALLEASKQGHENMVQLLLEKEVQDDTPVMYGKEPLLEIEEVPDHPEICFYAVELFPDTKMHDAPPIINEKGSLLEKKELYDHPEICLYEEGPLLKKKKVHDDPEIYLYANGPLLEKEEVHDDTPHMNQNEPLLEREEEVHDDNSPDIYAGFNKIR